jgi:2-amino-4-hydroxy-6-hydroxymethyldihydropteridine diphosphokinase
MNDLYLLLGSNLGNRSLNIRNAIVLLSNEIGAIGLTSGIYETDPWGNSNQGKFLNQVIKLSSNQTPLILLEKILSIEQRLGRQRNGERYTARTIDIDILFYGELILSSDKLEIPHPRLQKRKFVLIPLNEIAPDLIHPVIGKSISQILKCCPDKLEVRSFNSLIESW